MNEAVKSLLKSAARAPAGTKSIDGDLGLVATLEESEDGPARLIRILKGERLIRWSFHIQPGEPEPQFYPPDIPFLPGLVSHLNWHETSGLSVSWTSVPGEDLHRFQSKLKGMIEGADLPSGFIEAAEKAGRAGKKATSELWKEVRTLIPSSFVEAVSETADNIFGGDVPQEHIAQADAISAFLIDMGWTHGPDHEPSGASLSRVFQKTGKKRELTVRWIFGMCSFLLQESDDSGEVG